MIDAFPDNQADTKQTDAKLLSAHVFFPFSVSFSLVPFLSLFVLLISVTAFSDRPN
jgi:hypothetical protein